MRKRQACEGRTEMNDWDGDDGVAASGTPTGHGPQERGVVTDCDRLSRRLDYRIAILVLMTVIGNFLPHHKRAALVFQTITPSFLLSPPSPCPTSS